MSLRTTHQKSPSMIRCPIHSQSSIDCLSAFGGKTFFLFGFCFHFKFHNISQKLSMRTFLCLCALLEQTHTQSLSQYQLYILDDNNKFHYTSHCTLGDSALVCEKNRHNQFSFSVDVETFR